MYAKKPVPLIQAQKLWKNCEESVNIQKDIEISEKKRKKESNTWKHKDLVSKTVIVHRIHQITWNIDKS